MLRVRVVPHPGLPGTISNTSARDRSSKIERSHALLAIDSTDALRAEVEFEMEHPDNNIEDLSTVAERKLSEGVAPGYRNELINAESVSEFDTVEAKAMTAVATLRAEVVEVVESAAEQLASAVHFQSS
jgi:hypothetical protein